ncbi:MAG: TauD/TfdA dioxygenase family protein [Burkholderiaceae bacterium]
MSIRVRPLSHAIGAEITGVDLRTPLSQAAEQEVRRAWLEHHVIVFPGQELTPAQQISFGRMFGELDDHKAVPFYQHPEHAEIFLITNKQIGGKPSETRDTGREWHSDHSFTTHPTMATMLYCREIPSVGGTTMFTNMNLAYETLSPTLRAMLEPLEAVHNFAHYSARELRHRDSQQIAHMNKINPPVAQPVVRVHPETGRKALYLSEMMTSHFVGMTPQESEGLLHYLFTHSVRPEFTYRHAWSVNDLLMWDNRCTQHLALGDYTHDQPRHMHRITVLGPPCGRIVDASA